MDGRIKHLRSHYRLFGAPETTRDLSSRLDRVMANGVLPCFEDSLERSLPDDESVYIVRRVEAKMTLVVGERVTDSALARSWGACLARSILRCIAADHSDGGNLIRFENQADYVAHYLVALLKGTQHGAWFYHAFSELTALDRESAIKRTLLDNRVHLPAILRYVHLYGALDWLLSTLDAETRRVLWSADVEQPDELELDRPLFIMALQFVDQLEGWARMPRDAQDLFRDYLETGVPPADWRDPRSLAVSIFEMLRFLFVRGYLIQSVARSTEFRPRLVKALEGFEWLDRAWLTAALNDLLSRNEERMGMPIRRLGGPPTPRQLELLSNIASALSEAGALSDAVDSATVALKLLALLEARSPGWADDAAARGLLQNLVTVSSAMKHAAARSEFLDRLRCGDVDGALQFLDRLRRGDVDGALRSLSSDQIIPVRDACRLIASLGEPALALVEKLAGDSTPDSMGDVESGAAGVSLLLRSILDACLPSLVVKEAYPPNSELPHLSMLLLLIGMRLGGNYAVVNDRVDEGLCLLAGLGQPVKPEALRACWSDCEPSDHVRFQKTFLGMMAGQRLIQPETMHVFGVELATGVRGLVAGDASGGVWPLGRVIETEAEIAGVVRDWKMAWKEAAGIEPRLVAGDPVISSMLGREELVSLATDQEVQAAHNSGQADLLSAMNILEQGQTGRPDLDLTIAIVTCLLLRIWARWLRGFSTSSVSFLVEKFMRRPGRLRLYRDGLVVELERGPLDIVIEMAGYLCELDQVPWIPGGRVRFLLRGE